MIRTPLLTPRQRELFDLLRRRPIARDARVEATSAAAPLSRAQQRLWVVDQIESNGEYTIAGGVRLRGPLDQAALESSFRVLVDRHDILRTRFVEQDGRPLAVVVDDGGPILRTLDLREQPVDARDRAVRDETARIQARFDLRRDRLLRVTLLRLADEEWVLLQAMHHIIGDAWSSSIIAHEIAVLYAAHRGGRPAALPPVAQYADYARAQPAALDRGQYADQLEYWRHQLADLPALTSPPPNRTRPAADRHRGAAERFVIGTDVVAALKDVAHRHRATLFMAVLAVFDLLLARYTHSADVVIGVPVSGRGPTETDGLGCYVNMLVMRTWVDDDGMFSQLLELVRHTAVDAYSNQDVPFDLLVDVLNPPRSLSHHPFFQVMFTMRPQEMAPMSLDGMTVEPCAIAADGAKVDLSLDVQEWNGGLRGSLRYNVDLYQPETAGRMVRHFATLLGAAAADPTRPLRRMEWIDGAERQCLTRTWNETFRTLSPLPIHRRFEAQAEATPDAVAVVAGERRLTYAAVNAAANGLAQRIVAAGGRRPFVAVLVDHGPALAHTMLGVLKAAAAFVPVDPRWPASRIRAVLDALPADVVVVGDSRFREAIPPHYRAVDQKGDALPLAMHPASTVDADPEAPIYAMYTSGSTGTPKLAVIPHRGINNRFAWMDATFGGSGRPVTVHATWHCYDSAVWEVLWPLVNGGAVVVPEDLLELTTETFSELIERYAVTVVDMVPTLLATLAARLARDPAEAVRLHSLRDVIVGGEELPPTVADTICRHLPSVRLTNLYGPTEASIGCIFHHVAPGGDGRVPIGRPISNVGVFILDQALEPVPVGVPGEICVAGACVGLGYLGDERATNEVFRPNPVAGTPFPTIYRTGDLGRYRANGDVEYIGRRDRQLKIRGYRVEPAEIEAALARHPAVLQAAAFAVEGRTGRQLAAAVELRSAVTERELDAHLRERLPDYMVPSWLMLVDQMPVSASGKLDYHQLRAWLDDRVVASGRGRAPGSELETRVAALWGDMLGVDDVGVDDDFFALGGNSLLATLAVARLRQQFAVALPVADIFTARTVAQLAARIAALSMDAARPSAQSV